MPMVTAPVDVDYQRAVPSVEAVLRELLAELHEAVAADVHAHLAEHSIAANRNRELTRRVIARPASLLGGDLRAVRAVYTHTTWVSANGPRCWRTRVSR